MDINARPTRGTSNDVITGTEISPDKRGLDVFAHNTPGTPLYVVPTSGAFDLYNVNNLEDAIPLYVGLTKSNGIWLIKRFNEATGSMDYANVSNNISIATYSLAWTNRATLTYSKFHEITGI